MDRNRKAPAAILIVLGLGIFMLPFTPRWLVDWAISAEEGGVVILISPLVLIVTASVGSVLFLTGMWMLYKAMRKDRV